MNGGFLLLHISMTKAIVLTNPGEDAHYIIPTLL